MAGAVDVTHGGECEVLADVEVPVAKEQERLGDQVALNEHHGVLLCHLEGGSTVRLWAGEAWLSLLWGAEGQSWNRLGSCREGEQHPVRTKPLPQCCTALHSLSGTSAPNTPFSYLLSPGQRPTPWRVGE